MNSLKRLYTFIKPYNGKFFSSIFLSIFCTLARSANPFIIGLAITELGNNIKNWDKYGGINVRFMFWIAVALLITGLIDTVAEYASHYLLTDVVQNTMFDIRSTINLKINRLPVSFFDSHQQGDILGRITGDVDTVGMALQQGLLQVISSFFTLLFSVVFMFILSPFLATLALIIFPICFYLYRMFVNKSQPIYQELQNVLGDLNGFIQEYYTGFTVVKLFNQEQNVTKRFNKITDKLSDIGFRSSFTSTIINPILSCVAHFGYVALFLLAGLTILQGPLTIGTFVLARQMAIGEIQALIQYVWQATGPIGNISQLSGSFQAATASLVRVFSLLDEKEEVPDSNVYKGDPETLAGNVEFKNIAFGYKKDQLLMKDVSFKVKSGQTVAIVGPTGAGKTTLINLLMRFYDVNSGTISIDGIDISEMTRKQVRSMFGMVLQDPWLYYATIADNIRFGNLSATEYQVVDAAKTANVHRFIRTLPQGYSTMLNKESSNVSQGQKQLLTIARVLVGDPKIIILDEATSSVDTRLETLIQKAMKKVMQGRTSFIIAHRLSTIRDADLILVMNLGSIVEQGTHQELLEEGGMYKQLYERPIFRVTQSAYKYAVFKLR